MEGDYLEEIWTNKGNFISNKYKSLYKYLDFSLN